MLLYVCACAYARMIISQLLKYVKNYNKVDFFFKFQAIYIWILEKKIVLLHPNKPTQYTERDRDLTAYEAFEVFLVYCVWTSKAFAVFDN